MSVNEIKNSVLAVLAAIGAFVAHALGGWDAALTLMAALMVADYVTGVLVAAIWRRSPKTEGGSLSSVAGFKGLFKKAAMLAVLWLAVLLDEALGVDYIRTAVMIFFIGNEGISLLENLGLMGVPFPKFLKNMFEALQDKGDKGGGGDGPD